ncbi:MAG: SpoIID/LytB domain-containing protein [Candidatus Eremiobacteraeota bacterium]|nr:SpoIID/LytB domain-containing protein [Candidatus Eremiobacteraeota bacterium]
MQRPEARGRITEFRIILLCVFLSVFFVHIIQLPAYASKYEEMLRGRIPIDQKTPPIKKQTIETPGKEIILRVLLAKIKGNLKASAQGGIEINDAGNDNSIALKSSGLHVFTRNNEKIELKNYKTPEGEVGFSDITISPLNKDALLKINGRRYRGKIRAFIRNGGMCLINLVPLEEYLYGVLPKELKTRYIEAGKAQAVVARTYALGHIGKYEKYGYDFPSGTSSQVYGGFEAEDVLCNRAVDATKGQVLVYNKKLAKYPLYHSTCGGMTAGNESVFLTKPIPYLRSAKCDRKKRSLITNNPKKNNGKGNNNDKNNENEIKDIKLNVNPPHNCHISRYYRWNVEWDNKDLSKIINKSFTEDDTGTIKDLRIEKRGDSGRVVKLVIVTDKGEFPVYGDEIRRTFRFKDSKGRRRNLYSTRFNIIKKKKGDKITWIFKGSGWGHGIGMCQFGALSLAKKDFNYEQILKKYYTGVSIADYGDI